jgi:hypothetical protein
LIATIAAPPAAAPIGTKQSALPDRERAVTHLFPCASAVRTVRKESQ